MIMLKNYTAAFLEHSGKILLMHRAENRDLNPSIWSGVGGKMEEVEINDPYSCCLREIQEESGIKAKEIHDLTLRYIIIRQHKSVIRQSYIFFGKVKTDKVIDTDEGTLHWIPKDKLLDKKFSSTFYEMIKHYLSDFSNAEYIFVGTAQNNNSNLHMNWSMIEDF